MCVAGGSLSGGHVLAAPAAENAWFLVTGHVLEEGYPMMYGVIGKYR